jgi:hypothetical protein
MPTEQGILSSSSAISMSGYGRSPSTIANQCLGRSSSYPQVTSEFGGLCIGSHYKRAMSMKEAANSKGYRAEDWHQCDVSV